MMNLGDVIASFRKKKQIDQAKLAKALGVSVTYISLIENNKRIPSATLLKSIAKYFKVPPSALVFTLLKDANTSDKRYEEAFKIAEPLINKLLEFLTSEKDAQKKPAKKSK